MKLYDSNNATADIQRIKDDLSTYYEARKASGEIKSFTVRAEYSHMNLFYAKVIYEQDLFPGEITAHYTILILNGEIRYQN